MSVLTNSSKMAEPFEHLKISRMISLGPGQPFAMKPKNLFNLMAMYESK